MSRRPTRSVTSSPASRRACAGSVSGTQAAHATTSTAPKPASTTNSPRQSMSPSSAPPIGGARMGPSETAPMSAA
jgi:hypothetical protein